MSITSSLYQLLLKVYAVIPFKKAVCNFIKLSGINNDKFYKDLRFSGPFTVKIGNKEFQIVNHKSSIENDVFWKGVGEQWEEETIWIWVELCKNARVIFDVGANFGIYSLIAKAQNKNAEVYAFEPVERTYNSLVGNNAINDFNIHTEQIALSNVSGKQIFYDVPFFDQTSASLSADKLKNEPNVIKYEVTCVTLDKYVEDKGIQCIDLVKIDVELHEPSVIEGFIKYLTVFKPAMVIEVLTADVAEKLNSFFVGTGYRVFHLTGKNRVTEKPKIEAHTELWNYLLCSNEIAERLQSYIKS